jgi:hypothetical protein
MYINGMIKLESGIRKLPYSLYFGRIGGNCEVQRAETTNLNIGFTNCIVTVLGIICNMSSIK